MAVADFRNSIRKRTRWGRRNGEILEELAPELGIEAGKTDDEEDEGTERKAKKSRSEYSPIRSSRRGGKDDASAEKNPEEPELEQPIRRRKLVPPEKKGKRERTNRNADKLRMPSRKYNGIGK